MANSAKNGRRLVRARATATQQGLDSVYFLKLVMYLIIGTIWIRIENQNGSMQIPIPVGLILGLLFAMHDHFRIDRKIEYAVLLVAMLFGFWSQIGAIVTF